MSPRHRAEEFRRFLNVIDKAVPPQLEVHVVLDNSSTHKTPRSSAGWCATGASPLHFTPTYSSSLRALTIRNGQAHMHRYLRPLPQQIEDSDIEPSFVVPPDAAG